MIRVAMFGDIVGVPGMRAFAHAAALLRSSGRADLVMVNAENSRAGSGLSPDGYKELRRAGADAITLGDHCFKDRKIFDSLDDPAKPVARPANLARGARGKTRILWRRDAATIGLEGAPPIAFITVLGRLFMPLPSNDPFEAVDREIGVLIAEADDTLVVIEVHAEATSEKQAMAWHCLRAWPGRVIAVVGTHTHVPTADARIIDGKLAAMTDLGMCGGFRGVIGRKIAPVLEVMTRQNPMAYEVSDEDVRATGVIVTIDPAKRRAASIVPFDVALRSAPPGETAETSV